MAIIRKHHVGNYTVVDNGFIRDTSLSLKAKGIMLTLLSLPDDWVFTETWLETQSTDGITAIKSALNDLEKHGYLKREREHKADGTWGDMVYSIYESPISENPTQDNPIQENRTLLSTNTDNSYKDKPNTKETNNMSDFSDNVAEIIDYLNAKTGKHFLATAKATQRKIKARLKEGRTVEDFMKVIDIKVKAWKGDPKWDQFLRPETLFTADHFESYLNENSIEEPKPQPKQGYSMKRVTLEDFD